MSNFTHSAFKNVDLELDRTLRPIQINDFIGQETVTDKLDISIKAAKKRNEPLGHLALYGPPGLGKTTLAHILANEMGSNIVVTSGPAIDKPANLAGILTNLQKGDILFIDEIHRLQRSVEEYLYPAMEDFKLDIIIDGGPHARSVRLSIHPFTLIAATTKMGQLSAPIRSRFALGCRLDYYRHEPLVSILKRSSVLLDIQLDNDSIYEIAMRSRGTPRIANNLLRWVRDYIEVSNKTTPLYEQTKQALDMLKIDHIGLDEIDTRILKNLIMHYEGGPVGINTLATAIGEDVSTLEEVHEPFLIMQGLLKRTARGRVATKQAYEHLRLSKI